MKIVLFFIAKMIQSNKIIPTFFLGFVEVCR